MLHLMKYVLAAKDFFIKVKFEVMHNLSQLKMASEVFHYNLDLELICRIWRGGCIIRANLFESIRKAYNKNKSIDNLLQDSDFSKIILGCESSIRKVCKYAINESIPFNGMLSALSYFEAIKSKNLPKNLIQAQRDYFGELTYERIDKECFFHTKWE